MFISTLGFPLAFKFVDVLQIQWWIWTLWYLYLHPSLTIAQDYMLEFLTPGFKRDVIALGKEKKKRDFLSLKNVEKNKVEAVVNF